MFDQKNKPKLDLEKIGKNFQKQEKQEQFSPVYKQPKKESEPMPRPYMPPTDFNNILDKKLQN